MTDKGAYARGSLPGMASLFASRSNPIETHKGFQEGVYNSAGEDCWGCGHWIIGGGCWKNGQMGEPGWRDTNPDDSCEEWVIEDTEGTITGELAKHNKDGELKA